MGEREKDIEKRECEKENKKRRIHGQTELIKTMTFQLLLLVCYNLWHNFSSISILVFATIPTIRLKLRKFTSFDGLLVFFCRKCEKMFISHPKH